VKRIDIVRELVKRNPKIKVWKEFTFPKPFDTGIRLKDVLEDEVDERYYLPQEKVEILLSRMPEDKLNSLLYDMSDAGRDGGKRGGARFYRLCTSS